MVADVVIVVDGAEPLDVSDIVSAIWLEFVPALEAAFVGYTTSHIHVALRLSHFVYFFFVVACSFVSFVGETQMNFIQSLCQMFMKIVHIFEALLCCLFDVI